MLGVLCARPRPWILNSLSLHFNRLSSSLHHHHPPSPRRLLSLLSASRGGHGGLSPSSSSSSLLLHSSPRLNHTHSSSTLLRRPLEPRGEGSWNVAWDARPARWLHRSDSAWLLLGGGGVFACLAPPLNFWPPDAVSVTDTVVVSDEGERRTDLNEIVKSDDVVVKHENSVDNYKVTAVLADGRCLFRAIAHVACMRNGEEAPDEDRQRELADELRAQVVEELLKRREESEWFIEGDFDTYIKRIQQPFVWGGEPELLMASHVLKMKISVYMIDRTSGNLVNIANYGEEYRTEKVKPIKVLFHGYGHYEILETVAEQSCEEVSM